MYKKAHCVLFGLGMQNDLHILAQNCAAGSRAVGTTPGFRWNSTRGETTDERGRGAPEGAEKE